jgi:dihydrofolate synthase / folylpolyglutamate synthase
LYNFISYDQVESYLLAMPRFQDVGARAAHFGIDQIETFCNAIGNPQNSFKSIHVAGTNGKGTVCSMLASIYKEAGYKTGIYTSPHLIDVRERFVINGQMIPADDMLLFFNTYGHVIDEHPITFFELTTAIAFWYFAKENVDIAIIETGLGGRLDATNIVDPEACIITSIGLDHIEQLGNTLESIASEKAGIIKKGKPVILGNLHQAALSVISAKIDQLDAKLISSEHTLKQISADTLRISIDASDHFVQSDVLSPELLQNAKIVVDTVSALQDKYPVSASAIVRGLSNIRPNSGLRGRFEKVHPDFQWYFDGAHNLDALQRVIGQANRLSDAGNSPVIILTMMKDKLSEAVGELFKEGEYIYFYQLNVPRALKFEEFQQFVPNARPFDPLKMSPKSFFNNFKSNLVLFTGSFYFYSTVTEWMESLTFDS